MQKKHLSRIALSGLLALSMVPSASMQIYADNKTAEESTWGGVRTSNREANVYFNVNPEYGSFTEYGTNTVSFEHLDENSDQQYSIPEVTAKEGYKFVGWKGQGADEITWGADAKTFGVTGLCFYNEDATDGYASIEAVFEKEETPETKRTSNVYFTVNPEYGSFTEYGEGPVTFLNLDENSDEQYLIPAVTAKEGYKFVGWKGQGADEISWGSDAKTFGVTGLCAFAEGATEGYASLEAQFEKVETPVVKKTAHVTFTVDSEKGSFTEYGTNPVKFDSDEDNDQQFVIPEVTAKEGYKFVGWKGQGADAIEWDADAKTFGVTGLCHFAEGETEGYASIEAVFEKVDTPAKEDNKKEDSKKEDNKVSTGAATGLFGSLAGVTAAGASLVALLRKKNSK